jgi:hypothetical protein
MSTRRLTILLGAALPLAASCAHRADGRGSPYAQRVLQEVVRRHPEVRGMELAALHGDGCVTVAATDAGDVGDRCDGDERRLLRAAAPRIEEPTRRDPVYIVTEPLHDSAGAVVGLLMTDLSADSVADRAAVLARARAIRQDLEARIPSAAHLAAGTPAAEPAPEQDTTYAPHVDPRAFAPAVTNPWFPLAPGTTYRYRGTGSARDETNVVTVTRETRTVMGIRATVVHDQVFEQGELTEDTWDWYAQDAEGNVWYLGEDTKELRNGKVVSTAGSWEAGVDGAKPGVIMWGNPAAHVGVRYRQEYRRGVAEDMGKIVALREAVAVPYGRFQGCVRTEDTTPLEPKAREHKYYCRGVGVVKEVESTEGGSELVTVQRP